MIRAVVALSLSLSLLGCFPHNPRARTYAKVGEGAAILAGIGISAFANTTADCDQMAMPGVPDSSCRDGAEWMSTLGVVLIVGGLLGFVATVSTAEDAPKPKPVEIKEGKPAQSAPSTTSSQAPAAPAPAPGSDAGAQGSSPTPAAPARP